MRMEQLLYLVEISKCKSMSVASEKLFLTPQALSIAIKHLEEELGVQLLHRTNKGTSLTEKGWKLTKITEQFLRNIDTYVKDLPEMDDQFHFQEEYLICSTHGGENTFYPKLATHFLKNFPNTRLNIMARPYYEVYQAVQNKEYPFAFFERYTIKGKTDERLQPPIEFHPLFQYQVVCEVPEQFPISKYDTVPLEKILKYPFLNPVNENNSLPSILQFFEEVGMPRKIIPVVHSSMVKEMLQSGLGIAMNICLPFQDMDIFHLKNVKCLSVGQDVVIEFGYITRNDQEMLESDQALVDYISKNLNDILM